MRKKKALFVVNPISGGKDKSHIIEMIQRQAGTVFEFDITIWKKREDLPLIIEQIKTGSYDLAVAAGGDGTINQIAKAVINTNTCLGIIPLGSGNGLARHLGIPLDPQQALDRLKQFREQQIDACSINDHIFFCTSGIGFDANISKLFADSHARGFWTYIKLTVSQLIRYTPQEYTLTFHNNTIQRKAFLITFANASQYGNNAYIAPEANINDGELNLVILKPFKPWNMPALGIRMFTKSISRSPFVETFNTKEVKVSRAGEAPVHYDGEPDSMGKDLHVSVIPSAVTVLV